MEQVRVEPARTRCPFCHEHVGGDDADWVASSAREAASAMITISNVAQPVHWTRLNTVGSAETRRRRSAR